MNLLNELYLLQQKQKEQDESRTKLTEKLFLLCVMIGKGRILDPDEIASYRPDLLSLIYLHSDYDTFHNLPDGPDKKALLEKLSLMLTNWPDVRKRAAELVQDVVVDIKDKDSILAKIKQIPHAEQGFQSLLAASGYQPTEDNFKSVIAALEHPLDRPLPQPDALPTPPQPTITMQDVAKLTHATNLLEREVRWCTLFFVTSIILLLILIWVFASWLKPVANHAYHPQSHLDISQ